MSDTVVSLEQCSGFDLVSATGDLDVFSCSRLRSVVFDPSACSQPTLIVDLSAIEFVDSTGLGVLVAARRWTHTRSAALVLVVEPSSFVARVLKVAGLDAVFRTMATRDEAVSSLDHVAAVGQ
jgi:anti-sigma B factor antagonist